MKKILLLGGYEFLGSNLISYLKKENHLTLLVKRKTSSPKNTDLKNIQTLYVEENKLEETLKGNNFDVIINCMVKYDYNSGRNEIYESNIYLPFKILNILYHKEIIFITFNSFYTKFDNYNKLPFYQFSKKELENRLLKFSSKSISLKIEHLYGPNDNKIKFIPKILNSLKNNKNEISLTSGNQKRDFIYISDLLKLIKQIILNSNKFPDGYSEYEIGTGKSVILKTFINELKIQTKSESVLAFGKKKYENNEIMDSFASIAKIQKIIPWKPQINFKKGIELLIKKA